MKISFMTPPKLWSSFRTQTKDLSIATGPFLGHMISNELPQLRKDLAGYRNSLKAKRRISGALKKQGAKSQNIEVIAQTAKALHDVVREHNLSRDAFICRLILFLRSNDALLKHLEVPLEVGRLGEGGLERMPSSPMKAIEAVWDDPLYYVRHHVQENWECGIYRVALPRSLDWAACHLDDEDVEGTRTHRDKQKQWAQMPKLVDLPEQAPKSKERGGK